MYVIKLFCCYGCVEQKGHNSSNRDCPRYYDDDRFDTYSSRKDQFYIPADDDEDSYSSRGSRSSQITFDMEEVSKPTKTRKKGIAKVLRSLNREFIEVSQISVGVKVSERENLISS